MKATITKPDGMKVELEGLTDDIVKAVQSLLAPPVFIPTIWPSQPEPWPPPTITWPSTTVTPEPK